MLKTELDDLLKVHLDDALVLDQSIGASHLGPSYIYRSKKEKVFVKTAAPTFFPFLQAEAMGLEALARHSFFRVPKVYAYGCGEQQAFLAIEWIQLFPHTSTSLRMLGELLARQHLAYEGDLFGFEMDNLLGSTLQPNPWTADWLTFFKLYRLDHQFQLIEHRYHDKEIVEVGEQLKEKLPSFFEEVDIHPSLLHGDLWAGNTGMDENGVPVLFDPACYYGHHEAELSIMQMFGGFSSACFETYHSHIPKQKGFQKRLACYQLYHYLNHYLIFGSSYRPACLHLFKQLSL